MRKKPRDSSLTLTCVGLESCALFLEPWGTEYRLKSGEPMRLRTSSLETGDVEVSFTANGLVVGITSDAAVVMLDHAGNQLGV